MRYIDFHCDTLSRLLPRNPGDPEQALRKNYLHIDAERLHAAGYAAQFFAMFLPAALTPDTLERCLQMVDVFQRSLEDCSDLIAFAGNARDLDANLAAGRVSAFLTIEDSGIIHGDPALLRVFHSLGLRLITLTWNFDNNVGSPNSTPEQSAKGLTAHGVDFLRECERLGIIVDVSHLSDAGFWDVAKHSTVPFVASHSDSRAVTSHSRNLTDEMLKALAEKGGVSGLNYWGGLVRPRGGDMYAKFATEVCTVDDLAAHARHMADVAGEDVVALGSDFDGIGSWPEGLDGCQKIGLVTDALRRAGFTERQIDKITFGNAYRVISEVMK